MALYVTPGACGSAWKHFIFLSWRLGVNRLKPTWLKRAAVFGLALAVFAACSDDETTAPNGDLDPVAASNALESVVTTFFDDNDALQSLDVFGDFISTALLGPNVAPLNIVPRPGDDMNAWARRVQLSVGELQPSSDGPERIPVGALGKTFVYNPDTQAYEIDLARTDAPANGVWFILYAVDPILGQPLSPLQEIGYVEITDDSSFPTATIGLTAVVSGTTLLDIDVSGTFSETTVDLDFSGLLSNGVETLTFAIDVTGSETAFNVNFTLGFSPYNITFNFGGDASGAGTITATLSDGDDTIAFSLGVDAVGNIATGSGIKFNGADVAIISGNISNPLVTNAAGDPLTQQELQALEDLFQGIGEIFELFFGLVEFSFLLLFLAF